MVNGDNPSIDGKCWYINIWLLTFDVKLDTSDVGALLDAISSGKVFSHLPSVMYSLGQFLITLLAFLMKSRIHDKHVAGTQTLEVIININKTTKKMRVIYI